MNRFQTITTLAISISLSVLMALPVPLYAEESKEVKRPVREYRLGDIIIKGEKEKPQVYFIIPKSKFSLEKLDLEDDFIWEIFETELIEVDNQ